MSLQHLNTWSLLGGYLGGGVGEVALQEDTLQVLSLASGSPLLLSL